MYIREAFDNFDPLAWETAMDHQGIVHNLIIRAQQFLEERSSKEVKHALNVLDDIIGSMNTSGFDEITGYKALTFDGDDGDYFHYLKRYEGYSEPALIYEFRDYFEIEDSTGIKGGTWPEYFSVLSLAYISLFIEKQNCALDEQLACKYRLGHLYSAPSFLADAMESLCIAERIATEQKSIGARNTTAAKVRHAPANRIKFYFISAYEKGTNSSRRHAARKYYQSLPADQQRTLCPSQNEENAIRTLTNALRQHQKRGEEVQPKSK